EWRGPAARESMIDPGFLFPRARMFRPVAIDYAIVEMIVAGCSKRKVVQAGQAEPLAQVLGEIVQCAELFGLRGKFLSTRRTKEHLISAVHQHGDLIAGCDSGFANGNLAAA